uniref:Sm domain-containing protein n=1 Tax=Oryza punctata TaxID=4537 RepID=A0A0E0K079_ORYPU
MGRPRVGHVTVGPRCRWDRMTHCHVGSIWVHVSCASMSMTVGCGCGCGCGCNARPSTRTAQDEQRRREVRLGRRRRGRPVVVKLNSGVDYRGILACLDGYMNIAMEQTEEYVNGQLKNKYGDAFIRGNNGMRTMQNPIRQIF